uniref:Mitochondrial import inner membrane translocase subunit n=1 Tax=Strombidium rassoulzadegani TaxID=1082188 RepID=A0A7S3CMK0_9SPIT|mmetsp:Transcript_17384/g.29248  ORF Transcript_17384/g.29248 Transcript_17384/m.29248 type:complete len:142 (+) Transcript_17384:27-452(+)|eukprot:CAMPEP_0168613516 /NCGR_PEP_ID=MMETSP0449_2-20121227/3492_1 /TAXON_ID=1082188 /ORGANISM="Strombidium rassoulzadegani, Strain ras09" /LENGTH=141 /DNA_ID=CAMNT_0008654153 /DNA_START=16 /DNA_END=441 /DNA_ORIENTATION=-
MPSSWSDNPYQHKQALKFATLSGPVLNECFKNCVEFEFGQPSEAEQTCIKNCQSKSSEAFNMFMRVQYNFAKDKSWKDYIDLSRYTGMEVEHGLNTNHLYEMNNAANLGHFDPHPKTQTTFAKFQEEKDWQLRDLKKAALS